MLLSTFGRIESSITSNNLLQTIAALAAHGSPPATLRCLHNTIIHASPEQVEQNGFSLTDIYWSQHLRVLSTHSARERSLERKSSNMVRLMLCSHCPGLWIHNRRDTWPPPRQLWLSFPYEASNSSSITRKLSREAHHHHQLSIPRSWAPSPSLERIYRSTQSFCPSISVHTEILAHNWLPGLGRDPSETTTAAQVTYNENKVYLKIKERTTKSNEMPATH